MEVGGRSTAQGGAMVSDLSADGPMSRTAYTSRKLVGDCEVRREPFAVEPGTIPPLLLTPRLPQALQSTP